jgi:regulator of sigma E protease
VPVVVDRRKKEVSVALSPKFEADIGLQQAGVGRPLEWTIDDGKGPKVVVGSADAVRVSGRAAVGGAAAYLLAKDARDVGVESVKIEFPDRPDVPAREVRLPRPAADTKTLPEPKLGVAVQMRTLVVESVFPGGPAEKAGIRKGDRLSAADGVVLESEQWLRWLRRIDRLDVVRDGAPVTLEVGAADPDQTAAIVADVVLAPAKGAVVVPMGTSFPDGKSPAAEAGIKAGDEILEVGKAKIVTREDLQEAVKALPSGKVSVKVRTPGQEPRVVEVVPKAPADPAQFEGVFGEGALAVPHETVVAAGPVEALRMGLRRGVVDVKNMFRMIGRFFGGEINPGKTLGGPGTIVNISSRSAHEGLARFLAFLAFISVNLAVLNILPIPVLDGGSLLLQIVVALRRGKPLKEATVAYVQWAGFALLMLLMVFALKNDVVNLTN